jgi:hypothetical protein
MNVITVNEDDLRDLAIRLVDILVEQGIIVNCIDTDYEDEFIAQDLIVEFLENNMKDEKRR